MLLGCLLGCLLACKHQKRHAFNLTFASHWICARIKHNDEALCKSTCAQPLKQARIEV